MAEDSKETKAKKKLPVIKSNKELAHWLAVYKNPVTPEESQTQAKEKLLEIMQPQISYYEHFYGTYLKGFLRYGDDTITQEACSAIVMEKTVEVFDKYDFNVLKGETPLNLNDLEAVQAKSTDIAKTIRHQMYMTVRTGVMRAIEKANGINNQDYVQILNRFSQKGLDLYRSPMEQLAAVAKAPAKKPSPMKREFSDPIGIIFTLRRQLSPGKYTYIEEILAKEYPDVSVDIGELSQKIADYIQKGDLSAYDLKEKDRAYLFLLYKYYLTSTKNVKITQLAYRTEDGEAAAIPYYSKKLAGLKAMVVDLAQTE